MTVVELYTALTCAWIRHWGVLKVLNFAGTTVITPGLPSWVPDWNNVDPARNEVLSDHYTRLAYLQCSDSVTRLNISATRRYPMATAPFSGDATTTCLKPYGQLLRIAVKSFARPSGVVHHYMQADASEEDRRREKTKLWAGEARIVIRWAVFLRDCSSDITETLLCFTAVFNVGPHVLITNKYLRRGLQEDVPTTAALAKYDCLGDDEFTQQMKGEAALRSDFWRAVMLRSNTETLYMTNDGRLGLSYTRSVFADDVIALIVGSDFPLLLRRDALQHEQYALVAATILSDLPGAAQSSNCLHAKWEQRPAEQTWDDWYFRPTLPGDMSTKGRMWNYRVDLSVAVVSAFMRGNYWQENVDADSLFELTLV